MNQALNSNLKSSIQTALSEMTINPFQYNYQGSVPLGAKTIWPVYPEVFQTKFYESSWIFHIPKVGLLSQAILKISLTSLLSNLTSESNIGSRIFRSR